MTHLGSEGIDPCFSGSGRVRVFVRDLIRVSPAEQGATLFGWLEPGNVEVIISVPDAGGLAAEYGQELTLQVTALADELSCWPDAGSFEDAQSSLPAQWPPEALLCTGAFNLDEDEEGDPPAEAVFTGRIVAAELLDSPVDGESSWHISIRSLGGTYDVVADTRVVGGTPVAGGIVYGTCRLSGRVI